MFPRPKLCNAVPVPKSTNKFKKVPDACKKLFPFRARRGQGRSASEANLLATEVSAGGDYHDDLRVMTMDHDHDDHDDHDDDQAYYDGKNYDHRSIEQLRREAGLARPTRGNGGDHVYGDNYDTNDSDDNDYDDDTVTDGTKVTFGRWGTSVI